MVLYRCVVLSSDTDVHRQHGRDGEQSHRLRIPAFFFTSRQSAYSQQCTCKKFFRNVAFSISKFLITHRKFFVIDESHNFFSSDWVQGQVWYRGREVPWMLLLVLPKRSIPKPDEHKKIVNMQRESLGTDML